MFRKILMFALTAGLAAASLRLVMQRAEKNALRATASRKLRQKTDVQRWEGEGGNLR